jgi:hypothetical protein
MRARLSLPRVLLPHTCTQDGWFLQPKRRQARLPRRTVPSDSICGAWFGVGSGFGIGFTLTLLLARAPLLLATLLSHTSRLSPRVH